MSLQVIDFVWAVLVVPVTHVYLRLNSLDTLANAAVTHEEMTQYIDLKQAALDAKVENILDTLQELRTVLKQIEQRQWQGRDNDRTSR